MQADELQAASLEEEPASTELKTGVSGSEEAVAGASTSPTADAVGDRGGELVTEAVFGRQDSEIQQTVSVNEHEQGSHGPVVMQ